MTIFIRRAKESIEKWNFIPLFLILLLGILLRVLFLQSRGIWYDDAFSIILSRRQIVEIIPGTAADTMPPLYYFLLHYWGIISQQIWFLRLLNVLLSTFTMFVIYILGKNWGGKQAGLLAAFFVGISPFQIYHAQEIRMYMILELALVTHLYFFVRLFISNRQQANRNFLISGLIISGTVALYSHNLAIFTLGALDFYLLIQREWKKFFRYLIYQCLIGILFVPWIIFVPGQIEKIQTAFWTPKPGILQIVQAIITLLATLPLDSLRIYIATILIALFITAILLIASKSLMNRPEIKLILCLVFFPPLVLFIVSWLMRPIFVPRAFILSGLMIYLLAGIAFVSGKGSTDGKEAKSRSKKNSTGLKIFGIGILVLVSAISLPYQYSFNSFPRSEFRQMIEAAENGCANNCLIVHDNKLSYFPAFIYDAQPNQVFLADEPESHNDTLALGTQKAMNIYAKNNIQEAVGENTDIRFVVFSRAIAEYKQAGMEIHPKIKWLDDHYGLVNHEVFGDIEIYFYSKSR